MCEILLKTKNKDKAVSLRLIVKIAFCFKMEHFVGFCTDFT